MKIGMLARQVGVSVETIRFYESKGLVEAPRRSASGYRDYPEEAVGRLLFVCRAKKLGFSLREIKDLLALQFSPGATCQQVKEQAESKIEDIEKKIEGLRRIKQSLLELVARCPGRGPVGECPIIGSMDGDDGRRGDDDENEKD